jgi:hypothetical protein
MNTIQEENQAIQNISVQSFNIELIDTESAIVVGNTTYMYYTRINTISDITIQAISYPAIIIK